jgi:hypothetical protein
VVQFARLVWESRDNPGNVHGSAEDGRLAGSGVRGRLRSNDLVISVINAMSAEVKAVTCELYGEFVQKEQKVADARTRRDDLLKELILAAKTDRIRYKPYIGMYEAMLSLDVIQVRIVYVILSTPYHTCVI